MLRHGEGLAAQVRSTMFRIGYCRTAALGGRTYECSSCHSKVSVYNSCNDRHCPGCSGGRRAEWAEKASKLLHPKVVYFQVVFTVPNRLSSLILGNRKSLYRLHFQAAWKALQSRIIQERDMKPAAMMVLHTWNQRLGHHPHVHALVPGSGPSVDGSRWIDPYFTKGTKAEPPKPILVDFEVLGHSFRDAYLSGLKRLLKRGELRVEEPEKWSRILGELREIDWVVYIEPPPKADSSPEHVLRYLARYLTGGPISDRRLIQVEEGMVHFWARSDDKSGRQVREKQSITKFLRNWMLHILPKGFTKTRAFGAWSNTQRSSYQELSLKLMPDVIDKKEEPPKGDSVDLREERVRKCARCDGVMELVESEERPSWQEVLQRERGPFWYTYLLRKGKIRDG